MLCVCVNMVDEGKRRGGTYSSRQFAVTNVTKLFFLRRSISTFFLRVFLFRVNINQARVIVRVRQMHNEVMLNVCAETTRRYKNPPSQIKENTDRTRA